MVNTHASNAISKYTNFFGRGLPSGKAIILLLICASVVMSIASVALVHYKNIPDTLYSIIISGILFSIIALIIPTILTMLSIKIAIRKIYIKHIIFLSFIGEISFAMYILLGSILYLVFGIPIAILVIIVGAASLFGWWFFAGRMLLSKLKKIVPLSLVQPTLYILFYIPASNFLFNLNIPINTLLIKLYAGIFVFAIVIYAIISVFNRPLKKGLGINGIDTFSAMFQDWLFGISTQLPFGKEYGERVSISTDTIIFNPQQKNNEEKVILFIPNIHYGAMGNIGGSNFPYLMEHRSNAKHNATTFIMHTAVNEDMNPTFAHEISKLNQALDYVVTNIKTRKSQIKLFKGVYNHANVTELRFNGISIVIMSRAPNITEDIAPEVSVIFKKILESDPSRKGNKIVLIDAHNSRIENVSAAELDGVKLNTQYVEDYISAMKNISKITESNVIKLGVSKIDVYKALGGPIDLANGNMNIMVFDIKGYKYGIMQFNSNNMLPSLRESIVRYVKKRYNIDMEVCTTDTHAVNSISIPASNVLGRETKFEKLKPLIDAHILEAIKKINSYVIGNEHIDVKNFSVWGKNSRERITAVLSSVISIAKILVPTIIIVGFIAAAWIVSFI